MFKRALPLCTILLTGALAMATPALAQTALTAPAGIEFGSVDLHFGGSPRQSAQISSEILTDVAIGSLALLGPDANEFQIVADTCSNQVVKPLSSCSLEVEFRPGTPGPQSATIEIPYGEETLEVPISANATVGTLTASPASIDFSPIPYTQSGSHEGEENETEQSTVIDAGAGTRIDSVSIAGPDASSFSIQYGNCEDDIMAPGNSCATGVRFQPLSTGPKHATLLLAGDAANGPLLVPLEGTGLQGPRLSMNTTQALLGNLTIGDTRLQTFTATNLGDYPLYVEQLFRISGTPLMFPLTSDTCTGQILAPEASCAVTVEFAPTTTGEKDASILLIANTTPSINVLGIDGIGVAPAASAPLGRPLAKASSASPSTRLLSFPQSTTRLTAMGKTVSTGITATCPITVAQTGCRAVSYITIHRRPTTEGRQARQTDTVLGSTKLQLGAGATRMLRIRLTPNALALLRRRHHLTVTITTLVSAGGKALARETRTLELTLPARRWFPNPWGWRTRRGALNPGRR